MEILRKILLIIVFAGVIFSQSDLALAKHKKKHIAHAKSSHYQRHHAPSTPYSASIQGSGNLAAEINNIVNEVDSRSAIGVYVRSMRNGETLYTRNPNQSFVPASTLKVLTAEAALLYLGPHYKFSTSFLTDAKAITNGVLTGNLYLVHSGDPSLTFEDLADMITAMKSQTIQQITGNIYIDSTAYDKVGFGPGWLWNDKRFCYAAPITASIINHNCLSFRISPARYPGQLATIVENSRDFSFVQNAVVTKPARARSCYIHLGTTPENLIEVRGCMPKGHSAQGVSTVVIDPIEYNKSLLQALFRQSGIQVLGNIIPGTAPPSMPAVVVHESQPLMGLITEMLKKSDNIIAGSLFKKMGEIYSSQPGSWENGSLAVKDILSKKAGVNTWKMNVLDGSGLSRNNQVTPTQMMQVLDFAYHHDGTNYEFISSLPIAGIDGTLKKRLQNIAGKVRAKTGTMSGVRSLAGYVITREKEPLAFVIMLNGKEGGWKYKEIEDRIVTVLTRYSRT